MLCGKKILEVNANKNVIKKSHNCFSLHGDLGAVDINVRKLSKSVSSAILHQVRFAFALSGSQSSSNFILHFIIQPHISDSLSYIFYPAASSGGGGLL